MEQRGRIHSALVRNPSLRPLLPEFVEAVYDRAKITAAVETKLPPTLFPVSCPFTVAEIIGPDFLPE